MKMKPKRVVIIANGAIDNLDYCRAVLTADDYIICADGGTGHALAMGVTPDLVVGDADSIGADIRKLLEGRPDIPFIKYPAEKDKSDLELALDRAVALNPGEIIFLGALGGDRLEHTLANILLLVLPLQKGIPARILAERHEIQLTGETLTLNGRPGDYVSLLPLTGTATGVATEGLKYPLRGETLHFSSTRGLSNELLGDEAKVALREGLLLIIKTPQKTLAKG